MSGGRAIAILQVGRTRTGKTTNSKKLLLEAPKNMKKIVYDVNNEYSEIYNEPFLPYDEFMTKIKDVKNSFILFEEATIFFSTRGTYKELEEFLVRKRHTNNFIILNFHSFASIPKPIFNLVDFIIVFKTNDTLKNVKDKFDQEKLLNAYEEVRKHESQFYKKSVSLY